MSRPEHPVAIVTGGARGIGAAISKRLSADGFSVAIVDLTVESAAEVVSDIQATGGRAQAFAADVSQAAAVAVAVEQVANELGAPVALINNAGVTRDNLLFKMGDDDWDTVIDVHLKGAFLMSRAVQKHMVDAGWGRIVNISSQSSLGNPGQVNYSAAKAGLQGLTKTIALELGKFGVTSNAIAPGFIATEMTAATAERLGMTFEEFKESYARTIAVRRVGTPDDIADTVAFLASEAAGFISGQTIWVAGGPTV